MNREKLLHLLTTLTDKTGLLDFYLSQAEKLERKDTVVRVCDLDDTLFSRSEQLKEDILSTNRGSAGISVIVNSVGIEKFIEKYYSGQNYPKDILKQLDSQKDIILTAGMEELQLMKARAMCLNRYRVKIVYEGKDKVLEVVRYVLFELGYLPEEIIVYEDRPQFFVEHRELIEGILGCKLTVMYVEMNENNGYRKIEEII